MSKNNKNIKFGFFNCRFQCNIDDLNNKIKKLNSSKKPGDKVKEETLSNLKTELKNTSELLSNILDLIKIGKINYSHKIYDKLIEIDRETFIFKDDHIFFQILHDRDDAISKKKLGESRKSIDLDDDEYISEFTSVIFDKKTESFMVQYNKYAVSINQIGEFLSKCLEEYFQSELQPNEKYVRFPAKIHFEAVIDKNRLDSVKKNKCIEKMTIKGSLSAVDNIKMFSDVNMPIFNIGDSISKVNGFEFNFTITANKIKEGRKFRYESIDQKFCSDLFDAYNQVGGQDNIDVSMQFQNDDNIREVLNWSLPIKECNISFIIDSRKEIDYREIYAKMLSHI